MEKLVIKVEHAIKKYGSQTVLQDVSLEVEEGNMIGIVGRNGSGKTILFKAICGFVPLDEGVLTEVR